MTISKIFCKYFITSLQNNNGTHHIPNCPQKSQRLWNAPNAAGHFSRRIQRRGFIIKKAGTPGRELLKYRISYFRGSVCWRIKIKQIDQNSIVHEQRGSNETSRREKEERLVAAYLIDALSLYRCQASLHGGVGLVRPNIMQRRKEHTKKTVSKRLRLSPSTHSFSIPILHHNHLALQSTAF